MITLVRIRKNDADLIANMRDHYTQPKGFVGRQVFYAVVFNGTRYGSIAGGSATKFLPNRPKIDLNNIVNNIFFHVEGPYPCRNFVCGVLKTYRKQIENDWFLSYGDFVTLHETLVENHRQGVCYIRDAWRLVGQTRGYTAKRGPGKETNGMSGKRIWDTKNLRPKFVFIREP